MAMLLSTLLNGVEYRLVKGSLSSRVVSIENDSRKVGAGSLFVAITGAKSDGHDYIYRACEMGASCVVVDKKRNGYSDEEIIENSKDYNTTIIEMEDTRVAMALSAQSVISSTAKRRQHAGLLLNRLISTGSLTRWL